MNYKDIHRILDRMEMTRIAREDKICQENSRIYKEQMHFYNIW